MSLINKMLKDLEARDREAASPQAILEGLRPAPVRQTRPRVAAALGLLIVLAAAAGFWLRGHPASVPRAVQAPVPVLTPQTLPPVSAPVTVVAQAAAAAPAAPVHLRHAQPKAARLGAHALRPPVRVAAVSALPVRTVRAANPAAVPIRRTLAALTPAERARMLYHDAVRALENGHRHAAGVLLRRALGVDRALIPPRLLLAGLAIQGLHYRQAHVLLTQGLSLHPHALAEAMLLAQVDLHLHQADAAVAVLQPFAASPSATESFVALYAGAAMRSGQMDLAARIYRGGVLRYRRSGILWAGLGVSEVARSHPAAAKRAFTAALRCPLSPVLLRYVEGQLEALH